MVNPSLLSFIKYYWYQTCAIYYTLFIKKLTAVSKSGLEPFIMKNKFDTNRWNRSPFLSLGFSSSSLTLNLFFVAEYETGALTSSPNISIHSLSYYTISMCIIYFLMLISRKVSFFLSQHKNIQMFLYFFNRLWDNWWIFVWKFVLIHIPSGGSLYAFNYCLCHKSSIWVYLKIYKRDW